MAYQTDGRIVKNFSLKEMTNTLAREEVKLVLNPQMVEHAQMMQELRDWYGKSLNVSSWYRTANYNKGVGGASNSLHLSGLATDINNINTSNEQLVNDFKVAWETICKCHGKVGGFLVYKWGIHFDSASDTYGVKNFRYEDKR